MESTNEKLRSLTIRHAINLLRYGNGLEADIVKLLNSADKDISERLAARLINIEERGLDIGPKTTARLQAMLEEIREINANVYGKVESKLTGDLVDLAGNEAEFHSQALTASLAVDLPSKVPSPTLLRAIVTERPINGSLLSAFFKAAEQGRMDRITKQVNIGMTAGESVESIVRRIMGTKAANYKNGEMDVSRRSARSIVRTAINHTSNVAAQETWKANESIVKGWQFVSTLDSRTTIQCGALDGKTFDVGTGPVPPIHNGCRSISIAVTKSFAEMGLNRK